MIDLELAQRMGDRHLRLEAAGATAGIESKVFRSVCITADEVTARTAGGQHLLWMLANLLARQFAIVHEIQIAAPNVPIFDEAFICGDFGGEMLPDALVTTVRLIGGADRASGLSGAVTANRHVEGSDAAVEIILGDARSCCPTAKKLYCYGDGWSAFVGTRDLSPKGAPTSKLAFGPYFSACIAAGEAHKYLRGVTDEKYLLDSIFLDLWSLTTASNWESLPCSSGVPRSLPHFYLVGAGAVGQAVAATLCASSLSISHITVVDHDAIDDEGTNLNRCVLSYFSDRGGYKTELVAGAFRKRGIAVSPFNTTWESFVRNHPYDEQPAEIVALEEKFKFPIVLSCVDKSEARHAVQKSWPQNLLGGSTHSYGVEVREYSMTSEGECLMCSNPLEKKMSIEEAAGVFFDLSDDNRQAVCDKLHLDLKGLLAYKADPKCGSSSQSDLLKFADSLADVLPSIGFVSVGAGIILASHYVRLALTGRANPDGGGATAIRFSFLRPHRIRTSNHLRNTSCICCTTGRTIYERLWGTNQREECP